MKKEPKGRAGRPPGPVTRSFPLGGFTVSITGPKDEVLKWESCHNFIQLAVEDGELREKHPVGAAQHLPPLPAELRRAREEGPPDEGEGTNNVASEIGLRAGPHPADPVSMHLEEVKNSVGGF